MTVNEKAISRGLVDLLLENRVEIKKKVNPELLEKEKSLNQQIAFRLQKKIKGTGPSRISEINKDNKELSVLIDQLLAIEMDIRRNNPVYAAIRYPENLNLKTLQNLLDDQSSIIEYSLGKRRSFAWIISKHSIECVELAPRAAIEEAANLFYFLITARAKTEFGQKSSEINNRVRMADEDLLKSASTLSSLILAPIQSHINKRKLIFVPDGSLFYVPFAALPIPSQNESVYTPIITYYEISNLNSASTLSILREKKYSQKVPTKTIAVIADPVFDIKDNRLKDLPIARETVKNDNQIMHSRVQDLPQGLNRLPGTNKEAETIKKLVNPTDGQFYIGFNANKKKILGDNLSNYKYIHFATHAVVNNQYSGIALSQYNDKGGVQDWFLITSEIFNLELASDLVNLSACSTGLGKELRGEGLIGLSQGFFYAGANRVLVSLWPINDDSTPELMEKFYKKLLVEKKSPTLSLREAQFEMSNNPRWANPYFWSGFVIIGEYR